MNKFLYFLLILNISYSAAAQSEAETPEHFVIEGQVLNANQNFWEFAITSFFDNQLISLPLTAEGKFFKSVPIKHPQDIYLYLNNDAITIFAVPGDTLKLNWDEQNLTNTFKVSSRDPGRQSELDLMLELHEQFRQPYMKLNRLIHSDTITDLVIHKKVEEQFTNRIKTIISYPATKYSQKMVWDTYFNYASLLSSINIFRRTNISPELKTQNVLSDSLKIIYGTPTSNQLNEYMFYSSPSYREFLDSRIYTNDPFNISVTMGSSENIPDRVTQNCYKGMATLSIPSIREWYLTKTIINGFRQYPFEDANTAYQTFLPEIQSPVFRDSLQQYYASMQRLKPGNTAPDFILKNLNGEQVSLSDFKGKAVYIDFWGVYCGPCRVDIEHYIPKLHEKYKDKEVVFLNICVDVGEEKWKAGVKELKLHGVNLIAEGWTRNPVCQDYNIAGIPHYVLVDKEGKIANNNADRPYQLIGDGENELDKLLMIK